ncbi:MAG: hypothetical protein DSZ22_03360, partial [Thaumarchaeota archaeon]
MQFSKIFLSLFVLGIIISMGMTNAFGHGLGYEIMPQYEKLYNKNYKVTFEPTDFIIDGCSVVHESLKFDPNPLQMNG